MFGLHDNVLERGKRMLNNGYKEQTIEDLNKINREYKQTFDKTVKDIVRLDRQRQLAVQVIKGMDIYVTTLAHKSREFETTIKTIQMRCAEYQDARNKVEKLEQKTEIINQVGRNGVAGVLGGASIAAFAPNAALAIAMTFGTASTGTAIASLSGAAAMNAALAWLGGGALVAGGAGMAAGEAMLALTGPVGWVLAGTFAAGSLLAINKKNKEYAMELERSIVKIKKEKERIQEIDRQVLLWSEETKKMSNGISHGLNKLKSNRKTDCNLFSDDEMNDLTVLFNDTEILSKLIREKIEE